MKKELFILGAIIILVLLAGTCSQQIKESYKNINNKKDCMKGCKSPTQIYGNCSSKIEKDDQGNCYKTCPFECSDSSPYANCRYDSQCMGCGFKKFRVNCDGTINPEWSDNSVISDDNLDKIHKPKPLQTFESTDNNEYSDGSDASHDPEDYNDNLVKNTNSTPYIDPNETTVDLDIIKPGACGDIHFHYYDMNSNPSGGLMNSLARAGGLIQNQMQNGIQNSINKQDELKSTPDYNSAYNYGAPGSQFPTDEQGQIKQYDVKYTDRPSITGIFQDKGPLGANIGQYGTHIKGCNCPPSGSDVDSTKY